MKPTLLHTAFLLLFLPAARADQFATGQAADVVLGQDGFNSSVQGNTPNNFNGPAGVVRDPSSGKLFVSDAVNSRIFRFTSAASALNGSAAEAAFGQPDLTANDANQNGTATSQTLFTPNQIAFAGGTLWVADFNNHRVLGYLLASLTGNNVTADFVFGQPNFITTTPPGDPDPATASKMKFPTGVSVDGEGNLWVADSGHHRILRFDNVTSKADGAPADGVLGQADFNAKLAGTTNATLNSPGGICVDAAGRLWVADTNNHRVLRFNDAANLGNGAAATRVLGQPDFVTSTAVAPAATSMVFPISPFADAEGTLWISDSFNRRVLGFRNAAAKGNAAAADLVLGQPNFTSSAVVASARGMANPGQISQGANGTLWVCDQGHHRVLRYSKVKAPTLTIATFPFKTERATASVRGRTTGEVAKVTHRVGSRGPFRTAKGTTRWTFVASLKPGKNVITVVAEGPGGKSVPKRVIISRK